MSGRVTDDGLSEVIGFILIIAVLVVIASLYVTYVVPAQGREAEIEHMTYIKNQFVDFKITVDSLWINKQVNTSVSQNFEMGTLGQKTEGEFIFLPLTQPIGSDGKMEVNTSAATGTIQINIEDGLFDNMGDIGRDNIESVLINPDIYRQLLYYRSIYPSQITNMIQITIPIDPDPIKQIPVDPNDFSQNASTIYHIVDIFPNSTIGPDYYSNANWTASFNLIRAPSFFVTSLNATRFSTEKSPLLMNTNYHYEISMSLVKKNLTTTVNYPIFQNFTITSTNSRPLDFWVNLQDPAYGLDTYGPIIAKRSDGLPISYSSINLTQNWDFNQSTAMNVSTSMNISLINDAIKMGYSDQDVSTGLTNMGKLSYRSSNYYWIPQEYFYQMGGVFLNQTGEVTKLLPLISLGVTPNNTPSVSINKLIIVGQVG